MRFRLTDQSFQPITTRQRLIINGHVRREGLVRLPIVTVPREIETEYRQVLVDYRELIQTRVTESILPLLESLQTQFATRPRSTDSEFARAHFADNYVDIIERAFRNMRSLLLVQEALVETKAAGIIAGINQVQLERLNRSLSSSISISYQQIIKRDNLGDILNASVRENVRLIKSLGTGNLDILEGNILARTARGRNVQSLRDFIEENFDSTRRRAELIARDQTAKVTAAISQARQEALGVEEYVWRTAEDGRVRESHRANNGKIFSWDNPPVNTGHPGEDPFCRCYAEALLRF